MKCCDAFTSVKSHFVSVYETIMKEKVYLKSLFES